MRRSQTSGETSWKETKFGILPRSSIIQLEVQGTQRGLHLLRKISATKESLSTDLIKRIHKVCFRDILQDRAGVFRTVQVQYSGKEAPHYSKIHEMTQNLVNDIEHGIKHLPAIEISVTTKLLRKKYIQSLQKADNGEYQVLENIIGKALSESLGTI